MQPSKVTKTGMAACSSLDIIHVQNFKSLIYTDSGGKKEASADVFLRQKHPLLQLHMTINRSIQL